MTVGRRFRGALVLCALIPVFNASPADAQASFNREVLHQVNIVRAQAGVPPMRLSRALSRAARAHSADVSRSGNFGHTSSNGTSMERRVLRYTRAASIGETLAFLPEGDAGAATVVALWMDSPPHRANLLYAGFRRLGVGRAPGSFGGPGWVITADLASRR